MEIGVVILTLIFVAIWLIGDWKFLVGKDYQ